MWIPARALNTLLKMEGSSLSTEKMSELYSAASERFCYQCPDTALRLIILEKVELDFCHCCEGTFFDFKEVQKVLPTNNRPIINKAADEPMDPIKALGLEALFGFLSGL